MSDSEHTNPRFLVGSDLDRTLIYSPRALALDMSDETAPRLLAVEVHNGKPLSFMTEHCAELLVELISAAEFVPVTTRTRAQYQRVHLPGLRFVVTVNTACRYGLNIGRNSNIDQHGSWVRHEFRNRRAKIADTAYEVPTTAKRNADSSEIWRGYAGHLWIQFWST